MLAVPHVSQTNPQGRNSCLPACLSMVLLYQGVSLREQELCDLLGTQAAGTEVWNILLLEPHVPNCSVRLDSASVEKLREALSAGVPPIVFVVTRHLRYWQQDTIHAVVVVSVTGDDVHVNDPAFPDAPRAIPLSDFVVAWSELDFLTAFVEMRRETNDDLRSADQSRDTDRPGPTDSRPEGRGVRGRRGGRGG